MLIAFVLCACQSDRPISGQADLEAYWSALRQAMSRPTEPRVAAKTPVWVREDHALRIWVACVRGRGRKLGLTSHAEPEAIATTALRGCHPQEVAYARSLKAMGISGIGTDVRDDLGAKVSREIADERARSHGQLRADLDGRDPVTAAPLPPPP